jgi:hypothetical protein
VVDVPRPTIGPSEVLVQTVVSVVSTGTERALADLAKGSVIAKARSRPDLVRQVVERARRDGIGSTLRVVRARLGGDLPLGYSASGIALEVGEAVSGVVAGQLVATGGAGHACHAQVQAVPGLLCVPVPDGVSASAAAFGTISSIPLHALRLAEVGPGAKVAVVGLGLIGQVAVRLARAAGCDVMGIDVDHYAVDRAAAGGAYAELDSGDQTTRDAMRWSRWRGVDAVLVTAATASSQLIQRVPSLCRDRASVVIVGDVGLELDRRPFYERELTLRFARSYGPGRYERSYEDWGVDYPAGFVRWTEGRNIEAVLDLLCTRSIELDDLVTHHFAVSDAPAAYRLIETRSEPFIGIELTYPGILAAEPAVDSKPRIGAEPLGVGLIGSGAFASDVLLPAMKRAGFRDFVAVTSASGLSAARLAEQSHFIRAVSGADAIINDPEIHVVVIATPHDSHAELVARALRRGKHVFCEKPLALSAKELDQIETARKEGHGVLFVGLNRRWSEPVFALRSHLDAHRGPLVVTYRVSGGSPASSHWYHDRRQGGRLLGEVCHFVDTCGAITGADVSTIHAVASGRRERLLASDMLVSLSYSDGSLATIAYASDGHERTEKERIEVLGRGHTAVLTDYRQVALDGETVWSGRQNKGYTQEMTAFRRCLIGLDRPPDFIPLSRHVLSACAHLLKPPNDTASPT